MRAVLPAELSSDEIYSLLELEMAIEAGFGARYDDPANYGNIILYKTSRPYGDYYCCWWGDNPDETCEWSKLEFHFDRLNYRLNWGWQLISSEEVKRLMTKAEGGAAR